ncbi:MAG: SCO family protein [Hyphomicrobiales bacterium]|nr:SCO family protein [Hyphomicrobiales bacterium]MBV8824921.1 SCO family protein [Hyphomicrobiales bacterium]
MANGVSRCLAVIAAAVLSLAAVIVGVTVAAAGRLGENANVPLVTQDGEQVRFYDDLIKGKIVAVNFIYTSCLFTCPLETARLAQVQRILGDRVGKDIFFYSISIDPEHDTPAVLKEYMQEFEVGPGWTFLTGDRDDIDLLAFRLGMTDDPSITSGPGPNLDGHTPHLLIANEKTGQWLRNSSTDNPGMLAHFLTDFVGGQTAVRPAVSSNAGAPLKLNAGQYLFAKECAACHTLGQGDKVGPDLKGVVARRDRDWLAHYIREPNVMRAAGDPVAVTLAARYKTVMPNLNVGDRDLNFLLDYLDAQSSSR